MCQRYQSRTLFCTSITHQENARRRCSHGWSFGRGPHRKCPKRSTSYSESSSQHTTIEKDFRSKTKTGADITAAGKVGKLVAERANKAGVKDVVFDRGGYKFHGRVKALAEAAREAGLSF